MEENRVQVDIVDVLSSDSDTDIICTVQTADCTGTDTPLMDLLKQLMKSKQSITLMTNKQICTILQTEYDIDMRNLHVLEIDIYITTIKKYLKDWPDWEKFDKLGNIKISKSFLLHNYNKLKSFIRKALDEIRPMAKQAVKMFEEQTTIPKEQEANDNDPVLEINASRAQLEQLFFRHPNRKSNNALFNIATNLPSQIKVTTPSFRSILNWWGITITITSSLQTILYKHDTVPEFDYVLMNKRLRVNPKLPIELDQAWHYKSDSNSNKKMKRKDLLTFIDKSFVPIVYEKISEVLDFVKLDFKLLGSTVYQDTSYRRFTSKYPYVRYLYKDVKDADIEDIEKYDIQLQETMRPMYEVYVGSFSNVKSRNFLLPENSISITCKTCSVTFKDQDLVASLQMHFVMHHNIDDKYHCTGCREDFSMENLAKNYWSHKCIKIDPASSALS